MTVNVVTKEVFETTDGSVFLTEQEAKKHEVKLKQLKYFLVTWGADLNEGRGWGQNRSYIAVNACSLHFEFAEILCFSRFGNPHQFCQGVFGSNAMMPYWNLQKEPVTTLDSSIRVDFAVEDRFAYERIYGEGLWDLKKDTKTRIMTR